jgi:hypothetical protein
MTVIKNLGRHSRHGLALLQAAPLPPLSSYAFSWLHTSRHHAPSRCIASSPPPGIWAPAGAPLRIRRRRPFHSPPVKSPPPNTPIEVRAPPRVASLPGPAKTRCRQGPKASEGPHYFFPILSMAMKLNFGYVAFYGMSRSVTKVGMILMCRFSVINYVSFMLD